MAGFTIAARRTMMFSPGLFFGASQDQGGAGRSRAKGDATATQVDRPVMLGDRVYAAYFEDSSASKSPLGTETAANGGTGASHVRRETPTEAYVSYLHRLASACGNMFEAGSVLFVNIGRPAHSVRGLNGTSMNVYDEVIGSGNILWFEIDSAWYHPQGPAVLPLEKCFSSCKVCMNWLSLQSSAASHQGGEANSNVIVLHTRGNNLHGNNGGAGT